MKGFYKVEKRENGVQSIQILDSYTNIRKRRWLSRRYFSLYRNQQAGEISLNLWFRYALRSALSCSTTFKKKNTQWLGFFYLTFLVLLVGACAPAPVMPTPAPSEMPPLVATSTPLPTQVPILVVPTTVAGEDSLFSPVGLDERTRGAADAAVTFIEYGDFQCPGCAALAPILAQLVEQFPQDVRLVYRDFPLIYNTGHEKAALAAQAVRAAALQGKDWELHELLFAEQKVWSPLSNDDFEKWLALATQELGLDPVRLLEDMYSDAIVTRVNEAFIAGQEIGLPGTPFLLINGQIYSGPLDFASLEQISQLIILGEKQFTSPPPMLIDLSKEYLATLETEKGEIVIQFYPQEAPLAVNNFVFLARSGWFDGITFHRVLPGFVAQTGDPSGTGQGNPGYFFQNEISPTLSFDRPGVVGMANVGANTNGSQFFITYAAAPELDGEYTIFGQVISGMDVLAALTPRDPQFGVSLPAGDLLLNVSIEER